MEFVVRLGTTITGIAVSAAVNYLLFRPEYLSELASTMSQTYSSILTQARQVLDRQIQTVHALPNTASLDKIQTLLEYQISDLRYRKASFAELRTLVSIRQKLEWLRRITFYMETAVHSKDENERTQCYQLLAAAVQQLPDQIKHPANNVNG